MGGVARVGSGRKRHPRQAAQSTGERAVGFGAAVDPLFFLVFRLLVTAEIGAVDFNLAGKLALDLPTADRLADFVRHDAVKVRKWVTAVVLPSIRKTGFYVLPGMTADHGKKPWVERSLEDQRVILSAINTCRMTHNQASAAWLWGNLGMPMPPAHLLPVWWQSELHLTKGLFEIK